jgi:3-isopropylmalate/(R)-2-methylmalate dehydratase large subunit
MILYLIGAYTSAGGAGHAIEFTGSAIRSLPQENRFTVCNMAVEFAAFTGLIPPDDTTIDYIHGRPYAPTGRNWDAAVDYWRTLQADGDAAYDRNISIDCADIVPTVTWGTSPGHTVQIDGVVPDPSDAPDANTQTSWARALEYMDLKPGTPLEGVPIDGAFIGSCTNSRISDLREVVKVVKGRRVAVGVKAIVVPGSSQVKLAAEAEGIDKALVEAGFEWRESGCSMCFYAGGESFGDQERVISSTNRNFENRQGPRTRTHLASPTSVAASALAGKISDVRKLRQGASYDT